jgi:hypothetical protein
MKTKLSDYILEDNTEEAFQELEEVNAIGAGNVVGYTGPLGAPGVGASSSLEKGFWRKRAGKKVKTASPKVHNPDALALKEMYEDLFEFDTTTDRGMARLWADQPDVTNAEQPVKSSSPELDKDIEKVKAS